MAKSVQELASPLLTAHLRQFSSVSRSGSQQPQAAIRAVILSPRNIVTRACLILSTRKTSPVAEPCGKASCKGPTMSLGSSLHRDPLQIVRPVPRIMLSTIRAGPNQSSVSFLSLSCTVNPTSSTGYEVSPRYSRGVSRNVARSH